MIKSHICTFPEVFVCLVPKDTHTFLFRSGWLFPPINVKLLWVQSIMALPLSTHDHDLTHSPILCPNDVDTASDSEDCVSISTFDTSLASEVDSADLNSDSADSTIAPDGPSEFDINLRLQLEVANRVSFSIFIPSLTNRTHPSSIVN